VIARDREAEILREYEALLDEAMSRFESARLDLDTLTPIVTGLRRRVGATPPQTSALPANLTIIDSALNSLPDGRGRLPAALKLVMADGKARNVASVVAELLAREIYEENDLPSRNSISNRLNDLADQGYLTRVDRGVFQLAPTREPEQTDSDQPSLALTGAAENGAVPRVQTEDPTRPQKPPGEEVASPRPGHPPEGAPGDRDQVGG
jgi:hypothetical protein